MSVLAGFGSRNEILLEESNPETIARIIQWSSALSPQVAFEPEGIEVEPETYQTPVKEPTPELQSPNPEPTQSPRIDLATTLGDAAENYSIYETPSGVDATEVRSSRFGAIRVAYEGLIAIKNSFGSIKEALPKDEIKSAADVARGTVSAAYEKAKNNKRQIALGAAGLALAGVAYKYAPDLFNSHTHEQVQAPHVPHRVAAPEAAVHQHLAVQAQYHFHKVAQHAAKAMQKSQHVGESLRFYGDTVWSHASAKVHAMYPHLSRHKLDQITNQYSNMILKVNHIKDATKMRIGQFFNMPKLRLK